MTESEWYGRNTIDAYVNEFAKQTENFLLGVIEENLTEHGYHQKIEINGANLKAMIEKQIPKKPRFYAHNYYCTECGNLVGNNEFHWQRFMYCDKCGQKISWDSEV